MRLCSVVILYVDPVLMMIMSRTYLSFLQLQVTFSSLYLLASL